MALLVEWILSYRLLFIILCIIFFIGGAYLTLSLRVDNSITVYFKDNDPSLQFYQKFKEEYGNDEFLYIVYRIKKGVFNLDSLKITEKLVEELEGIEYVKKVKTITNIELIEGNRNGDLNIYNIRDKFPSTQLDADLYMHRLQDKPLYANAFISENAEFAAILCEIGDTPKGDPGYQSEIGSGLQRILSKQEFSDFEFWPTGQPVIVSAINDAVIKDVMLFTLICVIVLTALLFLFFRKVKEILAFNIIYLLGLISVIILLWMNDYPITTFTCIALPLLFAISTADGVHIIHEYQTYLKAGNPNRESILKTIKLVGFPCLFTTLTTVAGFASLTISPIPCIHEFGLTIAVGVLAVFIFSFTLLTIFLSFGGEKSERLYHSYQQFERDKEKRDYEYIHKYMDVMLQRITDWDKRYYKRILTLAVIVCMIAFYGISKIKTDASWLAVLGEKMKVFQDYKFVDSTMAGSGNFEILLDTKKRDGVKTLQSVQTLEKIQNFANSQDYLVKKTFSVVDIIKDINCALHNNDREYYRLPSSDEEVSQYILLYEVTGGEELEKQISADVSSARLTIYVKNTNTTISKRFYDDLVAFIESVKPADYTYTITGLSFMVLESLRTMQETLILSIMLALAIISIMMIFVFRSLKIGLISMLPNIFPIIITLGIMGLFDISLDFSRTLLGCIGIGLAVDDTIHLISRYRLEFDRLGNYRKALDAAIIGVGHAITRTTIILIIGFGACLFSNFEALVSFGMITAICVFTALIADYFIAPALILVFKPFGKEFDTGKVVE
ncbi:MAG: MMPL family transporter [Spirochaetota bacterium]|nr:MMPL family transporter [Spirochaetota bacterium]